MVYFGAGMYRRKTKVNTDQRQETIATAILGERDNNQFLRDHAIVARLPPAAETHKGFKI